MMWKCDPNLQFTVNHLQLILVWQLAWRYLRGKRSANAVPILSRISMAAIAVASCAMIILFSVFNGFENLIKDLYKAFYPEIKITAAKGKFYSLSETQMNVVKSIAGIQYVSTVIEDNVWLNANEEEHLATLKGIDTVYFKVNDVAPYIYDGRSDVVASPIPTALVGMHIASKMGLEVNNVFSRLTVYYPNPSVKNPTLNPQAALQSIQLKPDGVFRVQDEFDSKYVIAPLHLVQSLFLQEGKYSSVEISLTKDADVEKIKSALQKTLGKSFIVATRYEQNKTLYMVMKTEKWAVYAILVLVLVIASFNMVGALTLLALEKQKDIAILKAMGAQSSTIKKIFITEGMLWAAIGGGIGLLAGAAICYGQIKLQWIKLQGAFIIDAYPVDVQLKDFVLIIFTILVVGLLASLHPAMRAVKVEDPSLKAS